MHLETGYQETQMAGLAGQRRRNTGREEARETCIREQGIKKIFAVVKTPKNTHLNEIQDIATKGPFTR